MRPINLFFLLGVCLTSSGCSTFWEGFATYWDAPQSTAEPSLGHEVTVTYGVEETITYGVEENIRGTVDVIKKVGDVSRISSHAIRLPSNPLRTITAFDYEFPDDCGGHHFRVYEADGTQILEYQYAPPSGNGHIIRDYISGPNPFIRAGLWTAYDHTGDGVSDMTLKYARRGSGILAGTYSQGPMTGLDASSKRVLGAAYDRALRDSTGCRG
jgi:hypothetical protein